MILSRLRISLVIPAYNEEAYLGRCLDAISRQAVMPYEVIVIDNNSTDRTAAIAAAYPFVRVITEQKQGVVYARDAGFNAARGDIIGRIDADTIVPEEWTCQVQSIISGGADAATGRPLYYDVACPRFSNKVENIVRRQLAVTLRQAPFLQGANMVITKDAWYKVRHHVCHVSTVHEDLDLSLHLHQAGGLVVYDERMVAYQSARRAGASFPDFYRYVRLTPRTYAAHNTPGYRKMYPVLAATLLLYGPARLLYQGCHPATRRFSLSYALRNGGEARVSPVAE